MRISLYRGRLHRVCGGPKRWDIPRPSIPLGIFRRALELRKAAVEALQLPTDLPLLPDIEIAVPSSAQAVPSSGLTAKPQDAGNTGEFKEEHKDEGFAGKDKSEGDKDYHMDEDSQVVEGIDEPELNGKDFQPPEGDGAESPENTGRKRKRDEQLSDGATNIDLKKTDDWHDQMDKKDEESSGGATHNAAKEVGDVHDCMEVEGLRDLLEGMEVEGSQKPEDLDREGSSGMDVDNLGHIAFSEKDAKHISPSAMDIKDGTLSGRETSCGLVNGQKTTSDFQDSHCKERNPAPQEQGKKDEGEQDKLQERKKQRRAELEAKLKYLKSEKHRLVQMLKQVLNEEESKKQGIAVLQSPTSTGLLANAEGASGLNPFIINEPEISVTRMDLEEGELDFSHSPSPQVDASSGGNHNGPIRTAAPSSGGGVGRMSESPKYLSQVRLHPANKPVGKGYKSHFKQ